MTDTAIDLGGVRALSVRLVTCWTGAWFADVDLDPNSNPVTVSDVPSGKVTITIAPTGANPITLTGTVDPSASGRMVASVPVRVVGGLGWKSTGTRQSWHSDAGISSIVVEAEVAAVVGETVSDPSPVLLGINWDITSDQPASSVFGSRAWYVDTFGVTRVGTRPAATPDSSVEILQWDPLLAHGMLSADALVLPGTVLTDSRFDGGITVREAVQTWDSKGTRVEIWCGASPSTKLVGALSSMVQALGGVAHLKRYRYRIVSQAGDGRLTLQAVANPDGSPSNAPDVSPLSVAPGMSGLSALYKLSSLCTVAFLNGDPSQAFVESFDSASLPQTLTVDATGTLKLGPSATSVALAGGGAPVARQGDTVTVLFPGPIPVSGTVGGAPFTGTMTLASAGIGQIMTGSGKVAAG